MVGVINTNLKVERAKIHLEALQEGVNRYRSEPEKAQKISSYDEPESGSFVVKCESLDDETPLRLGLLAGDFIGNLRSSLDQIVCALVVIAGHKVCSEHCFPVVGKNSVDAQLKIVRSTYGMSDDALAVVKSFQPYHRGDGYKFSRLWRLNKLWNIDKHRNIALHSSISDEMLWLPSDAAKLVKIETIKNGAIMRIPVAFKDKVRLNSRAGVNIRFGNEPEGIELYVLDLREIYEFVSKEVIPSFDRFFP